MKKIIMIILSMVIMTGFIFAKQVECTKKTIIRSAVMAKDNVGIAKVGDKFNVLAEFGAWHFIKITAGSDHVGIEGWGFRKLLDGKKVIGDPTVKGVPGIVLHTEPSTSSPEVESVIAGASYDLIKKKVKWYQVGNDKYIYYYNFKII